MKNLSIMVFSLVFFVFGLSDLSYAKNDKEKGLPPGLQKKVDKGQSLPPGWQKKLVVGDVLEPEIYDHGVVVATDNKGLVTVNIEGKLVRLVKDTREIVEILNGN